MGWKTSDSSEACQTSQSSGQKNFSYEVESPIHITWEILNPLKSMTEILSRGRNQDFTIHM